MASPSPVTIHTLNSGRAAFNPLAILRGAINTALGRGLQGGSTITQQYAKNAYLTQERTITRKLRELVLSIKLETIISKNTLIND